MHVQTHWLLYFILNHLRIFVWLFAHDCRYEEKRWISRDGNPRSTSGAHKQTETIHQPNSEQRSGHIYSSNSRSSFEGMKDIHASSTKESISAVRASVPLSQNGPQQVLILLYILGEMRYTFLVNCAVLLDLVMPKWIHVALWIINDLSGILRLPKL